MEKNVCLKLVNKLDVLVLCDAWLSSFDKYIFIDDMDKDALKQLFMALERVRPLMKDGENDYTPHLDRALIKLNFMMS